MPLLFHLTIKRTPLIALYVRPKLFRLGNKPTEFADATA
jgi:hypothetical protein